jgi:hypothetical protein
MLQETRKSDRQNSAGRAKSTGRLPKTHFSESLKRIGLQNEIQQY